MISEKSSKCGAEHLDRGVFYQKAHKKHVFTCSTTFIEYNTGIGNPLACFQPTFA